jgi:molybdopterin-synthase adenylyltransferase
MIVIVGVGALGSHVAQFLRDRKEKIKVVDFDRVEQKNIRSQFHTKMGLGMNKASALQRAMQGMFGVEIEYVPHKLTPLNVCAICKGAKLVIDCTDNFATRDSIKIHCGVESIPCLHGALSADGTFAQVLWSEDFKPDPEGKDGAATCEDGRHLPFYAIAAGQIAQVAQTFLDTGRKSSLQLSTGGMLRIA